MAELTPGYEEVFTVTEYYDGPRQGLANFKGEPHFYDCIFDEARSDYSNLYRLTPVSPQIFELAREYWAIWERWESAFKEGQTTQESHPALPQDRMRHEEIKAVLDAAPRTDQANCVAQMGSFKWDTMLPLQVSWTNPKQSEGA